MKKTLRRVVAFVVVLAMCIVPMQFTPVSATTTTKTQPKLAYVPLDDRPVVWDRVVYAAKAAGFDMYTPEYDDIRTRLDNQGKNDNLTQHGDGASIMNWLEQMDANGCDYFIIHLDMMFSGGLVGSRYPDSETITSAEMDIFNRLMTLTNKADNHVYFIDIVMRLASTSGYKNYILDEYYALRSYGAKERIVLDDSEFGTTNYDESEAHLQTIYQNYQKGINGETLTFGEKLNQTKVNKYHKHRLRKLQLMNMVIQNLPKGTVYMVGVDDASPGNTIQTNELNFLYARMKAKGLDYDVMYDTDSCGLMMLARVTNDYYRVQPKIKVRYFGTGADKNGDNYSNDTLRENVDKHVASLNAKSVGSGGEIEFLVLTKPDTEYTNDNTVPEDQKYKQAILDLVDAAEYNTANNVPTIIVDASDSYYQAWNKFYTNLQDEMVLHSDIEFGKILGYSNWNTVGNAIGIALGSGVSRYTYLKYEENIAESSHVAQARSVTYQYVKDLVYNARHKVSSAYSRAVDAWMFSTRLSTDVPGWNTGNFYQDMFSYTGGSTISKWTTGTGIEYQEACAGEHRMNDGILAWYLTKLDPPKDDTYNTTKQVLPKLIGSEIYTNLNRTVQTVDLTNVSLSGWRFPWFRTFEITFDITPTLGTTTHTYYNKVETNLYNVPLEQTRTTFIANAKAQYSATSVTVKKANGTTVSSGTALIGTGFKVTLTGGASAGTYTVIIPGEVTGDGEMDSDDVRQVMVAVMDDSGLSAACKEAADFNLSGRIDSTDARQILQVTTGL